MPFYRSRRVYKAKRGLRRMRKGFRRSLPRALRGKYNTHKFIRLGENCVITGGTSGLGTIAIDGPAGFAIGPSSGDYNSTYQFGGAMQFQLNQTLEWKDFTNLFDRYRIKGVKVTIIPLGQPSTNAAPALLANTNYPTIALAVDNDDADLPTTWEQIAVKQDCKIKRLSKPVSVYIKAPKLANTIYDGITNAYTISKGWVNTQYADVPHYGLKFFMRDCPLPQPPQAGAINGANVMFRVVTKYYLSMKDPQ